MRRFQSVDEYIQSFEGVSRERLEQMRRLMKHALPFADEVISYNIPAYKVGNQLIVYFAGYPNHLGMYPGRTNSAAYNALASQYAHGKSTARFVHTEPLPETVIATFIKTRLQELGINPQQIAQ